MDKAQMYNYSSMLHDAFRTKANESPKQEVRSKFESLAQAQKEISDQLRDEQQATQNTGVVEADKPVDEENR